MDASSTNAAAAPSSAEERQALSQVARWWWAWIVSGCIWILAAVVILQFRHTSVALVGIIIGVMFLASGIQEFVTAALVDDWRWLRIALGVILAAGGIFALFNPVGTFLAIAEMLGFVFALIGIFWVMEAFATRAGNELWWLGLIAGIMMIGLGFWAGGEFLASQAYTLLVFAGVWSLLHGISDIFKAFAIRKLDTMVAMDQARARVPEPAPASAPARPGEAPAT